MRLRLSEAVAVIAVAISSAAHSSESTTFAYDASGRLTEVVTTGGVNSGLTMTYGFDAADNRITQLVVGATGAGLPDVSVILLPLNGFTLVPVLTQP